MRITIVIEHFAPIAGGAEGMAVAVVRGLMRRGHDVQVVARIQSGGGLRGFG
jgi:short-subunit dehydrogenase